MEDPEFADFWQLLGYHDAITPEIQRVALAAEVFWPCEIYYHAPADVRDGLIHALLSAEYSSAASNLMSCLAMQGDDKAMETLLELERNPRPWRKGLYVDPSSYAQIGGWTFDKEGQKIQLNFDTCYPMVKGTTGEKSPVRIGRAREDTCPHCGGPARRETDTMPQWAGSSWYFLRYMDPHNDKALASKEALDYWSPVDWYNGGMEHTTLHLLYSRFWHKFLYDIGVVPTKEPYAKRTSHGMILGEGGEKMSKSRGNVVNPNDIVDQYGADTMRLHIMFIGDFEKAVSWSNEAVKGSKRFLDRCFNLQDIATDEESISAKNESIVHKTIKKVSQDIDELKMNTAIAAMMTMVNEFYANGLTKGDLKMLMLMLSPFAPHMVEEMWELTGEAAKTGTMAMQQPWPEYDESKTVASHVEMAVQVLGKLKGTVTVAKDSDQQTVVDAALQLDKVQRQMEGMQIVKVIHVPNKLVNLIVKPC